MDAPAPGIYAHFKDPEKRYEVIGTALHTETGESLVLYRPLYTPAAAGYFVRPVLMFIEEVDKPELGYKGPRFIKIKG